MPSVVSANEKHKGKNISIVGGGLVGCLAACYFAERNFNVKLYEYRSDIRKMKVVAGRSINMAMSVRGREGLRGVGAEESITSKGIEMYSRMIHDVRGEMSAIPYGKKSQCILSIDRRYLNELLLTEAEKYPNVEIKFNQKLVKCNTKTGDLVFEDKTNNEIIKETTDLIVGCDGAYSNVRQSLMHDKPIDFMQSYISSYYLELHIPANKDGEFSMPPKHLHIWPRGDFMLIALPNQDKSFTCTLFMPNEMFLQIKTPNQVLEFFEKYFIDALDLIGREKLIETYFSTKPFPLMTIKCSPHHGEKCVLLGDSAHAMVPFYGQGMNCAFEDCVVFFELLDKMGFDDLPNLLNKYSEVRVPDAQAICDLAYNNYEEMRYLVTTRKYKFRKQLDNFLNTIFPTLWIPLYSMVTFSRLRYSEVVKKRNYQDKFVENFVKSSLLATTLAITGVALFKMRAFKAISSMF